MKTAIDRLIRSARDFAALAFRKVRQLVVMPLYNVSVRTKLFVYAGVMIALILVLAGYTLSQIFVMQSRHIPARAAVREIHSALLTLRSNEQQFINEANSLNTEFYLRQHSKSSDEWRESYRKFEDNYARLVSIYQGDEIEPTLQKLKPEVVEYRDVFLQLSNTYQQRGFHVYGREGELLKRAEILQASLEGRLQQKLLLLESRHALDRFLLHDDVLAVEEFNQSINKLRPQLITTDERVALDEYARMFQEVVGLEQKIGLSSTSGLRGSLNVLMADIMPSIQIIETYVLNKTSEGIAAIFRSIVFTTIALISLALALAILISRLITTRLKLLLVASQQIASGDLNYRVSGEATDELGQLARSFNAMAEKLQHSRKSLHERAAALGQSVRRFELVSKAVNEVIYEWNFETGEVEWGNGLVTLFGYGVEDKKTTIDWWAEHVHAEDTAKIDASLNDRLRRQSSTWRQTYRFRKANGQYVYCRDQGFIEYRGDKAVRMVGSLTDITHQKELERAKDEFISIASHQLRTPLGSIRWNLELLMGKLSELPRDTADYVQEAYKSTVRMLGLVSDLLSVARIEQHRVQDMPLPTELVAVIMSAIQEMKPVAQAQRVKIDSTSLKRKTITIVIDPKLFREVVQNLLSNAVKYTPPGGKVTVILKPRAKDVMISITDTGIGVPLEDQANLFGKFFRAKNVTTTNTEGSGLGLYVVKSYIESWGGRIWFESAEGKGTTFYMSIPNKPRQKT